MVVMSEDDAELLAARAAALALQPRPVRRMVHANNAKSAKAWHWSWRKLHCRAKMRRDEDTGFLLEEPTAHIDAGYCLDRYTIDNGEPQ